MRTLAVLGVVLAARVVAADPEPRSAVPDGRGDGDGYCDYVRGAASARAAVLIAPTVFGQFGLVEQTTNAVTPETSAGGLRLIAGVRVNLDGIYKGLATRDRALADCHRHTALERVRGETAYQALDARARVLDGALAETDKILAQTKDDLEARRTTAQEATATRLRVEELRQLATATHHELSLVPAPSGSAGGALDAFQRADDEVERYEGKLRRADAFDLSVRFGLDSVPGGTATSTRPYFAVLAVGINLGALWQGAANERAAAGRRRLVRSGRDPLAADATADRLRAVLDAEARRETETEALEADLHRQLETLTRLGGEDSKRYRQTVWFEWTKVRAEHAYLTAHVRALREVLGEAAP